jgi:peptidoglycan/xylan/chitin deacetylase (PgdA/CDA1 family)
MKFFKTMAKKVMPAILLKSCLKGKKFIFVYHDISNENEKHHSLFYSTRINDFYRQILFLKEKFKFISLEDIVSQKARSDKEIVASIVFDDGFYSVFKYAFPFLLQHQIPFTIFINNKAVSSNQLWTSNLILNLNNPEYLLNFYNELLKNTLPFDEFIKNPFICAVEGLTFNREITFETINPSEKTYCDSNDLKEMLKSELVNICSHSANHYVSSKCDYTILKNDLLENHSFIKKLTGRDCKHFAIPFGKQRHYNKNLIQICNELGYKYIYTTVPGYFTDNDLRKNGSLIPRISIGIQNLNEILFMINRTIFVKRHKA